MLLLHSTFIVTILCYAILGKPAKGIYPRHPDFVPSLLLEDVPSDSEESLHKRGCTSMSLRHQAAPKKYAEADRSGDDDVKDPLVSAKDHLKIPLQKKSPTMLIRKSPIAAEVVKSTPKSVSPDKMTKVTRPPPEFIKALILSKIPISSASLTSMPQSKENDSSSGFVVVDIESILKGKNAAPFSNFPASATVSAVPISYISPKVMPKPIPPPVSTSANRKSTNSSSSNSTSLPDPFESLGMLTIYLFNFIFDFNKYMVYFVQVWQMTPSSSKPRRLSFRT
jgi:hypothetical protein